MNDIVTVVIPVYNGELTIKRCVESVNNQTYKNIEVIIINDGSTDSSEDICLSLKKEYQNIKFFTQNNSGVSSSRNIGIDNATGNYIIFLDCDDILDENYVTKMHSLAEIHHNDLVICGMAVMMIDDYKNEFGTINKVYDNACSQTIINKSELISLYSKQLLSSAGNKFYNVGLLRKNNIKFDYNHSNGEDLLFNLKYLKLIDKIICINEPLYIYYLSNSGTLHTIHDEGRFNSIKKMYNDLYDSMNKFNASKDDSNIMSRMILEEFVFAIRLYCMNSSSRLNQKVKIINNVLTCNEFKQVYKFLGEIEVEPHYKIVLKCKNAFLIVLYFNLVKIKYQR